VRELTQFFCGWYGGPHRDLVVITTAAAFNNPSSTKRQVQRLAPVKR
jgi:hypothetical protein